MKTYARLSEKNSRTLDSCPKASKQASLNTILQRYGERGRSGFEYGNMISAGVGKTDLIIQNRVGFDPVIQRLSMVLDEQFPAVNEPVTGTSVFQDTSKETLAVQIPIDPEDEEEETYRLSVGQDYLNTGLSALYKADVNQIKSGKAQIHINWGDNTASIYEGHHRVIWKFYHGQPVSIEGAGLAASHPLGGMVYQEDPQPIVVQHKSATNAFALPVRLSDENQVR